MANLTSQMTDQKRELGCNRLNTPSISRTSPCGSVLAFLALAYLNAILLLDLPVRAHHVVTIGCILVALWFICTRPNDITKTSLVVLLIGLPIIIRTVVWFDQTGLLQTASNVATIVALTIIGRRRRLSVAVLIAFFVFSVIPESVVSKFVLGKTGRHDVMAIMRLNISPSYIPTPDGRWRVHVGPWGTTYHYTSDLAQILLVAGASYYLGTKRIRYLVIGLIGCYLLLFAGSRGAYIAALSMMAMYFANRNKRRVLASWLILLSTIVTVYGSELIGEYLPRVEGNQVLAALTRLNSSEKSGISAGRSWLWQYHLNVFEQKPLRGAGTDRVSFRVGDTVNGRIASAGSESFYTQVLASYGMFGFFFMALHLYLFGRCIRHPDIIKLLLCTIAIVNTASNSMLEVLYVPATFFIVAYICFGLDDVPDNLLRRLPPSTSRPLKFRRERPSFQNELELTPAV
jgi:hypothetical protein